MPGTATHCETYNYHTTAITATTTHYLSTYPQYLTQCQHNWHSVNTSWIELNFSALLRLRQEVNNPVNQVNCIHIHNFYQKAWLSLFIQFTCFFFNLSKLYGNLGSINTSIHEYLQKIKLQTNFFCKYPQSWVTLKIWHIAFCHFIEKLIWTTHNRRPIYEGQS